MGYDANVSSCGGRKGVVRVLLLVLLHVAFANGDMLWDRTHNNSTHCDRTHTVFYVGQRYNSCMLIR